MERFWAEESTFVGRAPGEVFAFLCDPPMGAAELTPMEDEVVGRQAITGVGSATRTTVELAARELDVTSRCVAFAPGERLALALEGDLEGTQTWRMAAEDGGTRLTLTVDLARPPWLPAYLQDEQVAENWGRMLVEQTLGNVREGMGG